MTEIYLDPYLFAVPHINEGEEAFIAYVYNLLDWKAINDENINQLLALRNTHEVLFELERYPLWDDLNMSIRAFGVDFVQPKDIVNIVDSFLLKFKRIEDILDIDDVLLDSYFLEPTVNRYSQIFMDEMAQLIALANLKVEITSEECSQLLLTKEVNSNSLRLQSAILIAQFRTDNNFITPFDIDYTISCCSNFDEYCTSINLARSCRICGSEEAWKTLIKINTYNLSKAQSLGLLFSDIKPFSFGRDFLNSIDDLNFNHQEDRINMILRTISESLLDINLGSTHALRKDRGPNSVQIEEDGYKAWRRDIDYEYHLHYWKKGNELVFSRVVSHNDFEINF